MYILAETESTPSKLLSLINNRSIWVDQYRSQLDNAIASLVHYLTSATPSLHIKMLNTL